MESGIISQLTDIWITVNTVMVAGSELMARGMRIMQVVTGCRIVQAGGTQITVVGILNHSGYGLTVFSITSMHQVTWYSSGIRHEVPRGPRVRSEAKDAFREAESRLLVEVLQSYEV